MQCARLLASFAASERMLADVSPYKNQKRLCYSRVSFVMFRVPPSTVPPHRRKSTLQHGLLRKKGREKLLFCPVGSLFSPLAPPLPPLVVVLSRGLERLLPCAPQKRRSDARLWLKLSVRELDLQKRRRQPSPFVLTVGAVGARSVRRCRRGRTVGRRSLSSIDLAGRDDGFE
jgi:hypothetical protein